MKITKTSSAVGAQITEVELSRLSEGDSAEIRSAFEKYGVLFFRDQELEPDEHLAFAKRFGPINVNRFFRAVDGHPQIAEVLKEPDQTQNIGGGWHTDHSYDVEPAKCSVLYARVVPQVGGDTLFAGMGAAYDALSDGFKEMLAPLRALHSSRHVFGEASSRRGDAGAAGAAGGMEGRIGNAAAAMQDAVHPVVIQHPETGRRLLYVNPGFTVGIEGWKREESKALLGYLYRHAMQPEFQTRFHWETGSLAMWDNRATWHFALNDYHGERRYLHRITVEGVPIEAAA